MVSPVHGSILKFSVLALILGIVVAEAFGQHCIREYTETGLFIYFLAGILGYIFVCYFLYRTYDSTKGNSQGTGMGVINTIWSALSILTVLAVGVLLWKDKVHWHQLVGIAFIICGFVFIMVPIDDST